MFVGLLRPKSRMFRLNTRIRPGAKNVTQQIVWEANEQDAIETLGFYLLGQACNYNTCALPG
jgi:aconitase A